MWPFGRKARIKRHHALLSDAAQLLKSVPCSSADPGQDAFDLSAIDLEFQSSTRARLGKLSRHLEHSADDGRPNGRLYLGDARELRDLKRQLDFVRNALSPSRPSPSDTRRKYRAMTYAEVYAEMKLQLALLEASEQRAVATAENELQPPANGSPFRPPETTLRRAEQVLAWIPDQAGVDELEKGWFAPQKWKWPSRQEFTLLMDTLKARVSIPASEG